MPFRLDPPRSTQYQVQHLAIDRLDSALEHLGSLRSGDGDVASHVHAVRRRCKQVRALARLVRPALGDDFAPFNGAVRDAARALAPLRNAHVSEQLRQALDAETAGELRPPAGDDPDDDLAVATELARHQLRLARGFVEQWQLPDGFAPLASGLERTYRRGRRGLASAQTDPTSEAFHEWRKDVKDLWYQLRLIESIAPSMLDPFIDQLGELGEDLGHHHDITMLIDGLASEQRYIIERLEDRRQPSPDADRALADIELAADRAAESQHQLARSAARAGATLYAEAPTDFLTRIAAYWDITARFGPEPTPHQRGR